MMLENAPEVFAALKMAAGLINEIGLPGLIALILLGPVVTAAVFFGLDFFRQRHIRQEEEARRQEAKEAEETRRSEAKKEREMIMELATKQQAQTAALVEAHRAETAAILRDLGEKHSEVSQYYKNNVELLKTTQHMASDMRDLILNNTRAVERLTNAVSANFFCPISREAATGRK